MTTNPGATIRLDAKALETEISEGTWSGATLQFPADAPLSAQTVRRIVEYRLDETGSR